MLCIPPKLRIRISLGRASEDAPGEFAPVKKCPKCLQVKPLAEFGLRFSADKNYVRLQSRCINCRNTKLK